MADLKPLTPKWKGRADCALWVGEHCVGTVDGRPDGLWVGETDVDYRICRTKAEARAWVESQLYGEAP